MKDWTCSLEFVVTSGELNREADSALTRKGVRLTPRKPGSYVFIQVSGYEDYLQALMGVVGELDAVLKPFGVTREIYAAQVIEVS